jgi:hypothetical protein
MRKYYNLRHKPAHQYKPGDKVWLEATNITVSRPSKKLSSKRYGPFKIIEQKGPSYKLELPDSWKLIHPVFHESLLTPYIKPKFDVQKKKAPPPPVVVGSEIEYEVEKILDSQRRRNQIWYLIKWKGYDNEENSWQAKKDTHAKDLIRKFHDKYPLKPR